MKRTIFFVLFIGMALTALPQNLVINPGFETWSKPDKPVGWTTSVNCQKDSVTINSGSYSCRHESNVSGTKSIGQKLVVMPGRQYNFSFFYKTKVTGSEHGCRIWCRWEDKDNNPVEDPFSDDILQPSGYMKSDSWQLFSTEITSPANAIRFVLEVRTYQNSIANFDNFVFMETIMTGIDGFPVGDMSVYPNPATGNLTICNMQNIQHIDIIDLEGAVLWSSEIPDNRNVTIPVNGLKNGIYFIRIVTDGKLITRKFVKTGI